MRKFILLAALALVAGSANAETYAITGGNWDSVATWNNNAAGEPSVNTTFDNGAASPACIVNGNPLCALLGADWTPAPPAILDGTYSGTLITDDVTNEVIGGSLVVTGTIGDVVEVPAGVNSWWFRSYEGLVVDFAANTQTSTNGCSVGPTAPAGCFAILPGQAFQFVPNGGFSTAADGTDLDEYLGATFDGTTLAIFYDGRSGLTGSDTLASFTLEASIVPVPAAVWLFGSALGLLGFIRRRIA